MNRSQLKRVCRAGNVGARIISDGCRDYVVQIEHGAGGSLLCDRRNQAQRFRSLSQVHALLNRFNIRDRRLAVRVADDEAGQAAACNSLFNDIPLARGAN